MSLTTSSFNENSFGAPWGVRYFKRVEKRTAHDTSNRSVHEYGAYSYSSRSVSASSYSCYKAYYPALYEKLKSPKAARKNFKAWQASIQRLPVADRPALPPQELVFAELKPGTSKRGEFLLLSCTLSPTYPNFCLECTTEFTERREVRDGTVLVDLRGAGVVISTAANEWKVLIEWTGWNDDVLQTAPGIRGLNSLEAVRNVRKGDSDVVVTAPAGAQFDKKVTVPEAFEADKMWSEPRGFYQVDIYIPHRLYRHK